MGKAAYCIEMLKYLNTGQTYKVTELANLLETTERNVLEYKRELCLLGYPIKSISGKYGGYKLDKSELFPVLKLSDDDKNVLDEAYKYLMSRNDFLKKESYRKAMARVFSSIKNIDFNEEITVINRYPLSMPEGEIEKRYLALKKCIYESTSIRIRYVSQKNTEKEHLFDPYELFMYNNAWFVIGWNHSRGDVGYFKINRISSFELTYKKFTVFAYYNRNDYIDDYGFKNNGDWYHIEFEAYNTYAALVKERIYGRNQEIIPMDEKTTLVKVDMQNKESILVFVLGFNRNLKVLEPKWLKDELISYSMYLNEEYSLKEEKDEYINN